MPPDGLKKELHRIGRKITAWRVELAAACSASIILAALWVFSFSDIFFRYPRPGRVALWLILVGLATAAVSAIVRMLTENHSVMATAAHIERTFPELDNHLINFLQFAGDRSGDPFKKAYVRRGVPQWSTLDVKRLKNRSTHRRANVALAVTLALMILPVAFSGEAWAVAVRRLVNPFSSLDPVSLSRIIEITPGDASILQGQPVVLSCKARGKAGHKVRLEIHPADDRKTTYSLGQLQGTGEELFSYKIAKVTTDITYRFKAGDSPVSAWHRIESRAPLGLTAARIEVAPPAYTRLAPATFDALGDPVTIPGGSTVTLTITCNSPLQSATATFRSEPRQPLTPTADPAVWTGTFPLDTGNEIRIEAANLHGEKLGAAIAYELTPDQPPAIEILAPNGRIVLPPGEPPVIDFKVADDYAISRVTIQRLPDSDAADAASQVVETWTVEGDKEFTTTWTGAPQAHGAARLMAFVVTAEDNQPGGLNVGRSQTIVFNAVNAAKADELQASLTRKADAALARVVDLQRGNIQKTILFGEVLDTAAAGQWQGLRQTQQKIRELTKTLLTNPARPLGNLTESLKQIYMNEMSFVIDELGRIPEAPLAKRPALHNNALNMEQKILRYLTYAESAAQQTQVEQKTSVLQGLLKALIKGQSEVIAKTTTYAQGNVGVGSVLVDRQDALAAELADFIRICRTTADLVRSNEEQLAAAYEQAAVACEEHRIREDMLLAAEELDRNSAAAALPHEKQALAKLETIHARLEALQTAGANEKTEEMLDVLGAARDKLGKIKALHKRALDTMEMVKANQNLDTKETDVLEEEYQELLKNTKQALLEIPTDLHIFQELNAANDIVEDVITIFQECEQEEGTEDALENDEVVEVAFTKDDSIALLEDLEQAEDRIDDWEMWLDEAPDTNKFTVEAMDQEEMPDEGAALGALESQVEDIIGDLLKESDDPDDKEKADDSASNRAVSDIPMAAAVTEGDLATYSGKGRSGNEAPDHKEQDGRSNVGRQGMSVGETSAGSGTIQEGDDQIEARRTQDPTQSGQVDAEGEADTKGFGGGKQGTGRADDVGDGMGGTQRMDSSMGGGKDGMDALMIEVQRMYDQASMKNVRAPSLKRAAHHIRQASDAIAEARSIDQIRELKKKAAVALKKAQTELAAGSSAALDTGHAKAMLNDVLEGGPDEAPPQYRGLVNEYYRALNDEI